MIFLKRETKTSIIETTFRLMKIKYNLYDWDIFNNVKNVVRGWCWVR